MLGRSGNRLGALESAYGGYKPQFLGILEDFGPNKILKSLPDHLLEGPFEKFLGRCKVKTVPNATAYSVSV